MWQTRRGGRQPGARGPKAKDGFSELERAYLKVHRNAKGLTNQEIADNIPWGSRSGRWRPSSAVSEVLILTG